VHVFSQTSPANCGRAKDGESLPSAVEPIFGDMVEWLYRKALTKLLTKMPVGRGRAKTNSSKVKQRFKVI